jgi:hypothetical protein
MTKEELKEYVQNTLNTEATNIKLKSYNFNLDAGDTLNFNDDANTDLQKFFYIRQCTLLATYQGPDDDVFDLNWQVPLFSSYGISVQIMTCGNIEIQNNNRQYYPDLFKGLLFRGFRLNTVATSVQIAMSMEVYEFRLSN